MDIVEINQLFQSKSKALEASLFFLINQDRHNLDFNLTILYDQTRFYHDSIKILSNEFACALNRLLSSQPLFHLQAHSIGKIVDFPKNIDVRTLLQAQANLVPDSNMFLSRDSNMTYSDAIAKLDSCGKLLQEKYFKATGNVFGPDIIIPVVSQNSIETIFLCLTITSAGGAYLPIDETNPKDRVRTIFEDAGVEFYMAKEMIDAVEAKFLSMDEIFEFDKKFNKEEKGYARNYPEDLAYVIFTSGKSYSHTTLRPFYFKISSFLAQKSWRVC